jgi:hypothetical protein
MYQGREEMVVVSLLPARINRLAANCDRATDSESVVRSERTRIDNYVAIFQILRERNLTSAQGVIGRHNTGKYVRKDRFATNALWNAQPCHCDDRVHPSGPQVIKTVFTPSLDVN